MVIISGTRTAEDIVREHLQKGTPTVPVGSTGSSPKSTSASSTSNPPPSVVSALDYLVLNDISCVDAKGKVFEQYDQIKVAKDIFRNPSNQQLNFTPYQAASQCESQGLFLPSVALSCNILAALYTSAVRKEANGTYTVLNPDAKQLLDMYKNKGNGNGWHAQNTLIDYKQGNIIHYPIYTDYPSSGGTTQVNQAHARCELPFKKTEGRITKRVLANSTLEDGVQDPLTLAFIQQYTGLANPNVLVEIGTYFGQPTHLWLSSDVKKCTDTRAAWLGCDNASFNLSASDSLYGNNAARGVQKI